MLPAGHDTFVFPQPLPEKGQPEQRQGRFRGLTLLDQLAIAALPVAELRTQELRAGYAGGPAITQHAGAEYVAREAYSLAEAMLTERQIRLAPTTPQP